MNKREANYGLAFEIDRVSVPDKARISQRFDVSGLLFRTGFGGIDNLYSHSLALGAVFCRVPEQMRGNGGFRISRNSKSIIKTGVTSRSGERRLKPVSIEPLRHEVRNMLILADDKVRAAVKAMATGSDEQRVRAAGQLVFLRRRKDELEARMEELEHCPDDTAHTLGEWIKEDWMILMHRLAAWMGDEQ